jgi:hypothetical protein
LKTGILLPVNLSRRNGLTRGNGTITSFVFDPVSRLSAPTQDVGGASKGLTISSFVYNPASQITSQQRNNDSHPRSGHYSVNRSYGNDGLNKLTSAGAIALGYDARGNRTSSGTNLYTYTSENQIREDQNWSSK